MSIRYVWQKFNTQWSAVLLREQRVLQNKYGSNYYTVELGRSYSVASDGSIVLNRNQNDTRYQLGRNYQQFNADNPNDHSGNVGNYEYAKFIEPPSDLVNTVFRKKNYPSDIFCQWVIYPKSGSATGDYDYSLYNEKGGAGAGFTDPIQIFQSQRTKGETTGYASSSSSGQYPSDGVSGNLWFSKLGSDNIDASAVSIPSSIMGGTAINITVTPGTGKVY